MALSKRGPLRGLTSSIRLVAMGFDMASATSSNGRSQDRLVVFDLDDVCVVAVADGAGGISNGGAASDAVINAVHEAIERDEDLFDPETLCNILCNADHALARRGGESTAVVIALDREGLVGASVGDSEAWLVGAERIDRLTETQDRRRVGSGLARPVSFRRARSDATLVAGTDGLFKYVSEPAIVAACRRAVTDAVADGLVLAARLPSGALADDVAVVLVRLDA